MSFETRERRKANQEWELAGLARADNDMKASAEHTRRARLWERGINPDSKEARDAKAADDQRDADTRHAQTVAERFAEMAANFRTGGADIPQEWTRADYVREVVLASHANREPLRLDLLAVCKSSDLSHDIAGILRGDEFQSARFALAYHPRDVMTAEMLTQSIADDNAHAARVAAFNQSPHSGEFERESGCDDSDYMPGTREACVSDIEAEAEAREQFAADALRGGTRTEDSRIANHIDGFDRDDLGESPDY